MSKVIPKKQKIDVSASEIYGDIRLNTVLVSPNSMKDRMQGRCIVKLPDIVSKMEGNDIPGDWVTIGVIAEKSSPKNTKNNSSLKGKKTGKTVALKYYDIGKTIINLILCDKVLDRLYPNIKVGDVIAILNPKILIPTEVF